MNSESLNFNILDIGMLKRDNFNLAVENKGCYALSCRIEGRADFHSVDDDFSVEKGDMVYIPKGAAYSQHTQGEIIIFVHLEMLGNAQKTISHYKSINPEKIVETFLELVKIWKNKEKNYIFRCKAILYNLIAETDIIIEKNSRDNSPVYPAVEYINEHFSEFDFSLQKACEKCNISRVYFNRVFKEQYSITPLQYVNKLRVQKAEFLIKNGGYTHNEIAQLCGFCDTKYFYTVFKKITGFTTGEYKRNKKEDCFI